MKRSDYAHLRIPKEELITQLPKRRGRRAAAEDYTPAQTSTVGFGLAVGDKTKTPFGYKVAGHMGTAFTTTVSCVFPGARTSTFKSTGDISLRALFGSFKVFLNEEETVVVPGQEVIVSAGTSYRIEAVANTAAEILEIASAQSTVEQVEGPEAQIVEIPDDVLVARPTPKRRARNRDKVVAQATALKEARDAHKGVEKDNGSNSLASILNNIGAHTMTPL